VIVEMPFLLIQVFDFVSGLDGTAAIPTFGKTITLFYNYSGMEEEVTKHTKKIYESLKSPGRSFWEKTKEVAIEIFIIVFAVTLSIWFHAWSDHRHEQKEAHEFLIGLKNDLSNDILLIEENKTAITRVDSNFMTLLALINSKSIDTINERMISRHLYFDLLVTHPNIARYEGFKSSGKIGTIENDSLKQNILVYYQQMIPNLSDVEEIVNSFQTRAMELEVNKNDNTSMNALAKSFKMQALLQFATQNIRGDIEAYNKAQEQAKKIIVMINE
jgi:hypothetical protein